MTAAQGQVRFRRINWQNAFGYDYFISFKLGSYPDGSQVYAANLASQLQGSDFSVFFSETEIPLKKN